MITTTYTGTVTEDSYGYRISGGYDPSLELILDNGGYIRLGNAAYSSIFTDMSGKRIKITIEELEPKEQ